MKSEDAIIDGNLGLSVSKREREKKRSVRREIMAIRHTKLDIMQRYTRTSCLSQQSIGTNKVTIDQFLEISIRSNRGDVQQSYSPEDANWHAKSSC